MLIPTLGSPAAGTDEGKQDNNGGCGPVLALGTWEAGLITTGPLLQYKLDRNIFE